MIPKNNEFYKHFKGNLYKVITLAIHSETGEQMVVYQGLYGDYPVYCRPLDMFVSEVDHEKYPDAMQKMRFVKVTLRKAEEVTEPSSAAPMPELEVQLPSPIHEEEAVVEAKAKEPAEESCIDGVHPLLLKFLDAENVEERLEVFKEMQEVADQHMLDAVAASLDISLSGMKNIDDASELIFDNLLTQKRYESIRWR